MVTFEQAKRVYETVNAGLVSGLGNPNPGQLCVEAAICYALGEKHSDSPKCVGQQDRGFSIALNDKNWSSSAARAMGLKRLSIAQLGSVDLSIDQQKEWRRLLMEGVIGTIVPIALRSAASLRNDKHKAKLETVALRCEVEKNANAIAAAVEAANYATAATKLGANANTAAYHAFQAAANYAAGSGSYHSAISAAQRVGANYATADEIYTKLANIAVEAYRAIQAPGIVLLDAIEATND